VLADFGNPSSLMSPALLRRVCRSRSKRGQALVLGSKAKLLNDRRLRLPDFAGFTLKELKREIEDGAIVAVWTALGERMTREELVAVAMQKWEQSVIEAALGKDAASVLPEAIRLVELRARVPRYQRDALRALARREGTSVDAVLTRELEDVVSAHAEELTGVPGLSMAMQWPAVS